MNTSIHIPDNLARRLENYISSSKCEVKSQNAFIVKPLFLTKIAIAKVRNLTASRFDPGVYSCCQMTVCCESSSLHQNQLDFKQKAICFA